MFPLENIYNLLTSWGLFFFLTPGARNDKTLPRPLLSELNYVFALTLFHILSFDLFPFSRGNTPSCAKLNRQVLNSSSLNGRHIFFMLDRSFIILAFEFYLPGRSQPGTIACSLFLRDQGLSMCWRESPGFLGQRSAAVLSTLPPSSSLVPPSPFLSPVVNE